MAKNKGKPDNLKALTTEKAREIGQKGGKKSVESRREKKLMSQIYGEFLAEKFKARDTITGKEVEMTGASYLASVIKKILSRNDSAAVSLMKEIREATEGQKVALTDPDGGPLKVVHVYLPDNKRGDGPKAGKK
jgi:hypothetical protein